MSQTATWAVPSAPSGLAMRNTVNTIVDVLRSSSSGASAPSPTVAGMFWFDESVSPAVLRIRNSSNTAWIRIIDTADAAAARTAIGAPPTPQGGTAGPGQNYAIQTVSGGVLTLPAGGTWQWNALAFNASTGVFLSASAGANIGGTSVAGPNTNVTHLAFVWRLS